MKRGFAIYFACLLLLTCFLGWYLTRPKVLTVGLFAGSNWNVPEGDSYALLEEAIKLAVEAGQMSISMLQRRMRIGYARAGRLIDEMAARGIVSQSEGSKPRQVLITREQYQQMFGAGGNTGV